jgi:hypothetical protein
MPTLASLTAAAYGALVVAMLFMSHGHGSLARLLRGFMQPGYGLVIVIAALVAFGLARRQAWAWWLGLAGALFQLFRLVSWYVQGPIGRVPGTLTLLAFGLLVLLLVLLAQRKVRTACNR